VKPVYLGRVFSRQGHWSSETVFGWVRSRRYSSEGDRSLATNPRRKPGTSPVSPPQRPRQELADPNLSPVPYEDPQQRRDRAVCGYACVHPRCWRIGRFSSQMRVFPLEAPKRRSPRRRGCAGWGHECRPRVAPGLRRCPRRSWSTRRGRAQWRVGGRAQLPTGDLHARLGARDNRCGRVGAGELVGVDDIAPPLGVGTAVTGIPDRPTNGVAQDLGVAR